MASFPASRRAQAAHEFLTTYAWAFLVVLFALLFLELLGGLFANITLGG